MPYIYMFCTASVDQHGLPPLVMCTALVVRKRESVLHRHHSEAPRLAPSMPGMWGYNWQLAVCPRQPARPTPAVKKTQLANLQLRH